MTTEEAMRIAVKHHQAGRLAEAEGIYRQVLRQQSDHPDALHLLGVAAHQAGRSDTAVELIDRAITLNPNDPAYHSNLGEALRSLGRVDEAIAAYSRAIELGPDYATAHSNLGIALRDRGKFDDAVLACSRAVRLKPGLAGAHNNLGVVLRDAGKFDQAAAACRKAIELEPASAEALCNLGTILLEQGNAGDAVAACARAIQINPGLAEAWYNLGNGLNAQDCLDEAIAAYEKATALKPDHVLAHANMGNTLKDLGRLDEALACYDRAVSLRPVTPTSHDKVVSREAGARYGGGSGSTATALARQDAAFHGNRLFALHFHPDYNAGSIFAEHRQWNLRHAAPLMPAKSGNPGPPNFTSPAKLVPPHPNERNPQRRLKVGYVSPDLYAHPVGRFLLPLLQCHDHSEVEVVCYSDGQTSDATTARLRRHADAWRDISGLSDEQVARQVREDQIDILIDLAGHTAGNRLLVFATRPAPVQVTYLGYPDTTGMSAMDYRITDSRADPPGMTEAFHTEQLVRLPDSFLCYLPAEDQSITIAPAPARREVTFGSFNAFAKINAALVALWAQILQRLPGAKLLIKCRAMISASARQHVVDLFAKHGIGPDRLELQSYVASYADHLRMYDQVDIALDTFPYHGTTTTCEALWMGAAVITLAGKTHVSRVGVSLLSSAGLPELIAHSQDEYVETAVNLATDLPERARLRSTLRQRMRQSPLMGAERFARNMEGAYRQMWQRWIG